MFISANHRGEVQATAGWKYDRSIRIAEPNRGCPRQAVTSGGYIHTSSNTSHTSVSILIHPLTSRTHSSSVLRSSSSSSFHSSALMSFRILLANLSFMSNARSLMSRTQGRRVRARQSTRTHPFFVQFFEKRGYFKVSDRLLQSVKIFTN